MKVKEITRITVTDPDTNAPVEIVIYKEDAGGIFGIDASYLENTEDPVHSPFGNGNIRLPK